MNPKLIIASIAGIGVLGGGVTGCYYAFGKETTVKQEDKSNNERTQTTIVDTSKNQETGPQTQNRESTVEVTPQDRSQLNTVVEQSRPAQEASRSSGSPQGVVRTSESGPSTTLPGAG